MRLALAFAALVVASVPVGASDRMAGWYLAMVTPSGKATINERPFGSEAVCLRQLNLMRSVAPDVLGQCVDLETPR